MHDEFAEEGYHPLDLVVEQKKRISDLEEENRRLREALLRVLGWQSMLEFLAPSLAAPANLGGLIAAMKDARAALSQED